MRRNVNRKDYNDRKYVSVTPMPLARGWPYVVGVSESVCEAGTHAVVVDGHGDDIEHDADGDEDLKHEV